MRTPRAEKRLDTLFEFAPALGTQEELVLWFLELVAWVRPSGSQSVEVRLRYLAAQLERQPEWRERVARALSRLVETCDVVLLLTSAGIPRDFHLAGALVDWTLARCLPAACNTHDATQILTMAFRPTDIAWLRRMASASWLLELIDPALHDRLREELARSLIDLTHEIISQAHSAGLRGLADLQRSPFRGLYETTAALNRSPEDPGAARALAGRLRQALQAVEAQRIGLAHTAAALARDLQQGSSFRARLSRFVVTWRAMVRLQLVGLLGNVLFVAPLAAALAYVFQTHLHHPLLSVERAEHILEAQSLMGPSVLFAALTGVLLWISSMVGAFVDNWARVIRLSERLATNAHALRAVAPARAREHAERLTRKVGGLAANLTLGLLLGGAPTAFALAELPIEIRHVTVSAGSVAMAAVAGARGSALWGWALSGVALIGLTNVLVSFSLALWFALTSARGSEGSRSAAALMILGIRRWASGRASPPELGDPSAHGVPTAVSSRGG